MKTTGSFSILGFILAQSAVAAAAPTEGRVRVSLDTQLLAHEDVTLDPPGSAGDISGSQTKFGLGAPGAGVGLGFGIGDGFILGGRLLVSTSSTEAAGQSATATGVSAGALGEYAFPGDAVRPFLGAALGYESTSAGSGDARVSSSALFLGPVLGLHWFATESVSIDPSAALHYVVGNETVAGVDLDRSGYALAFGVALSGWFGGSETPPASGGAASSGPAMPKPFADGTPPGSAMSPAQEDSPVARRSGMAITVPLGDGVRVRFGMDPDANESVQTTFIFPYETPNLRRCESLAVSDGTEDVTVGPFTTERLGGGSSSFLLLRTTTTLSTLATLAGATATAPLHGCGESWLFTAYSRAELRRFVRDMSAEVRRPLTATRDP